MTEQEYINSQELARVRCATEILSDIVAENSITITLEQKREIMEALYQWQDRLFKANKITLKD